MRPSDTVGNTPLLKINDKLYAKFEVFNPSGSIKDRIATYIINNAEKNNLIITSSICTDEENNYPKHHSFS